MAEAQAGKKKGGGGLKGPRPVFIGIKILDPSITKDKVKIIYTTRNAATAMKGIEDGAFNFSSNVD